MKFGPDHYVPVLKLKTSEKSALPRLATPVCSRVTPLFEVVERREVPETKTKPAYLPTVNEHLTKAFKALAPAIAPFSHYFVDCREMAADGAAAASDAFARAAALGRPFVPVTSISRTADVAPALAYGSFGIAIRLSVEEFEAGTLPSTLPAFMKLHGLKPQSVDLIVDLGAVDHMVASGVETLAAAFLADVPAPALWRTFSLSACGFPKGLGEVKANSSATPERLEWNHWRDELHGKRGALARLPTFSDCGIQHRSGVEGFDGAKMKASAAIRHAMHTVWHLEKGVNIRDNGGAQFQGLATNVLSATSAAPVHCEGCKALHATALNPKGYSSLRKWREFGTIHHITLTVESLAALPWP